MTDQSSTSTPVSKKRSHDEAEGLLHSHNLVEKSEETHLPTPTSPPALQPSPDPSRQPSPPISIESEARSITPSAIQATPPPASGHAQVKKRKLTYTEKEYEKALRASEKEDKDKQRAEEAQRKEQEKQARDEEKCRKEEEKEAAKRQRELDKAEKQKAKEAEKQVKDESKRKKEEERKARDAEKQTKDDAKRKKEEEKNKKERSQLRLASFFQKPTAGETSRDPSRSPSRRSSVISLVGVEDVADEPSTKTSPQKKPDAKHGFLPFFTPKNVRLAPMNRFSQDKNLANMAAARLNQEMQQEDHRDSEALTSTFKSQRPKRPQKPISTLKEIVDRIHGTSTSPIDLTDGIAFPQLSDIPYKVLSFREDVRPPYIGTYTRIVSPKSALKLSRRPFTRQLPSTNYDYDSEAEWEPPNEDDEDLESGDDESDVGEEVEEDMDGFLDDEDDLVRRKQVVGEMTPISSGLCWVNTDNETKGPLEEYRIQTLWDEHTFPIDPFSTAYWPKSHQTPKQQRQTAMQPPRLPLSNLNPNRSPSITPPSVKGEGEQQPTDLLHQSPSVAPAVRTQAKTAAPSAGKPLKLASEDVLPAFKQAVEGSDLTKAGLIEILKKQ
jgi:chromatin assembly factor 1 subunit A